MIATVATKHPAAVEFEVRRVHLRMYPGADRQFVRRVFGWATDFFSGAYRDYLAVDAKYHDFEHTLQGTLCMARLLRARHEAGAEPVLSESTFQLGMMAILMHDTGYLKRRDDPDGTGAKYTVTHVERSSVFAGEFLGEKGYSVSEIRAVQHMIQCTGINANLASIPFQSEGERIAGFALGTSDYLGQMAAVDYVDKLPILYAEFAEAARFAPEQEKALPLFTSAEDLARKTPGFWRNYVLPKLEKDFEGLYRFLNSPYPDGPNPYVEAVEANMRRVAT
jgi:hypothetical protein